jgi:hypothetical protein
MTPTLQATNMADFKDETSPTMLTALAGRPSERHPDVTFT